MQAGPFGGGGARGGGNIVARLRAYGAETLGEVAQYEDSYRLCHLRGSEEIIVALAEQLN